ncbi:MAG: pyridoxine 5'-phosphate synthase [Saprospiraceae bacterium]
MSTTRLSVNVNKIALLRNSRGGNLPNLVQVAKDCEAFGAEGITVHPRPDERHIRYADVPALRGEVTTEFNIEGYPSEDFMRLVLDNPPHQCTLVPDSPDQLTSDHGWDTVGRRAELQPVIKRLQEAGIRVSLFVDPDPAAINGAAELGAERVELYTGYYARNFAADPDAAVAPHREAARRAAELGVGLNAGHDLNLANLRYYQREVSGLLEVSIGHALVADALYYGLANTIQLYLKCLD